MSAFEPRPTRFDRRRFLATGPAVVLLANAGTARAQAGTPAAGSPVGGGKWTFTDDRGVTTVLPAPPERVVAQVSAAAALWDYGVRPVGIFGPSQREDGTQDPQSGNMDLAEVVSIGEIWGDFDLEEFVALEPDLLVSQLYADSPLWYVPEEVAETVAGLVATVGIQVQGVSIRRVLERFAELAGDLGADLDSSANVAAREEFLAAEDDLRAAIVEKPGLSVIAVAGDHDTLYVANPEFAKDLIYFRELGLDVVPVDGDEFWDALSWEQANKYPADLILNDARTQSLTLEQLSEFETWRALPAVVAGQVAGWYPEPSYSYLGYAPVLRELAAAIHAADASVVP
ncbi:MAG: ABC transporter substrate-binding protein [Chloroflexia bacterium]|nr:ABC transporter substrate-binding protein [Chloroflexia bacterium]MDQ3411167.1 ABC transporter substrate-binding protein [Chloroflexota bacterium]